MLYDRFREACEKRGTTITQVLRDIGRAEGNTGSWKAGKSPKLDIVMEMAEHLNMTLDDFVYGDNPPIAKPSTQNSELSDMEQELLEVFSHIPADRQQQGFLYSVTESKRIRRRAGILTNLLYRSFPDLTAG